jgi:hypothetical protein
LIAAGSKLVVTDPILHVANLTIWSNQLGVNLAEGKRATVINEGGKIKAALNVLSQWRTNADFIKLSDMDGLFRMNYTWDELASRIGDTKDAGVVNAQYYFLAGEFAKDIVAFEDVVLEAVAKATNGLQAAEAKKTWYRLSFTGGQLKIEKKLVNLPYKAGEGKGYNSPSHMRNQIMRSAVIVDLLHSERTGTPLMFAWDYNFGFKVSYYIARFQEPVKVAYETARSHQISAQLRQRDNQFRQSIAKTPEGVAPVRTVVTVANGVGVRTEKPVSSGKTEVPVLGGGSIKLEEHIGRRIAKWVSEYVPFSGPVVTIYESNLQDTADNIMRLHLMVELI